MHQGHQPCLALSVQLTGVNIILVMLSDANSAKPSSYHKPDVPRHLRKEDKAREREERGVGFVPFSCAPGLKDLTVPEYILSVLEGGNQARIPPKSFRYQSLSPSQSTSGCCGYSWGNQ